MSKAILLTGFAVLLGAMVALEVVARAGAGRRATLADVVNAAVRHPARRAAALLAWLWLGWHLFVR
ncbi:MAG: DUF6186 family protein [Actinomycetota bacterium]|nr:DUF6186 family protein [Actinomycetota bacterium]